MSPVPQSIPCLLATDVQSYLPVMLLITMALVFGIANLVLSRLLGPRRLGPVKGMAYESGMNAVGDARKRFNVRFYLIAMVFLVFDIEIIFLYPCRHVPEPRPRTHRHRDVARPRPLLHPHHGRRLRLRVPQGRLPVRLKPLATGSEYTPG